MANSQSVSDGTAGIASRWQSWAPYLRSILRIVTAIMFFLAGTTKTFAFPAGVPPDGRTVPLLTEWGAAGVIETIGGALMLFGLFSRPVAFLLAGEMAVAYLQFHLPKSIWPTLNNGIAASLYCFIWLYISSAGPGPWSLDAMIRRRRR